MKKTILTIAIVLGLGMVSFGQQESGLFNLGFTTGTSDTEEELHPLIPEYGANKDTDAPLGSGIAVLLGLGGAYLVAKNRKKE